MPRTKRTKRGHSNHNRVHKDRILDYRVNEHVIIVGKGVHPKKYVVKIIDLWEDLIDGMARFTARYYYYPSDLPKGMIDKVPQQIVSNEIFLSSFTSENSLQAIVSKCIVVNSSQRQYVEAKKDIYICRYQFNPWNIGEPFAAIDHPHTNLDRKDSMSLVSDHMKGKIGPSYQASIPTMDEVMEISTSTSREEQGRMIDKSTRIWNFEDTEDVAIQTFLFLVKCLQLSVGNIVYVWQADLREEITCIIIEHLDNGKMKIVFSDGSDSDIVLARYVRGVIQEDEALECLYNQNFDYAKALIQVSFMLVERLEMLREEILGYSQAQVESKRKQTKATAKKEAAAAAAKAAAAAAAAAAAVPSGGSNSPANSSSNGASAGANTRAGSTRKASMIALQRICLNK